MTASVYPCAGIIAAALPGIVLNETEMWISGTATHSDMSSNIAASGVKARTTFMAADTRLTPGATPPPARASRPECSVEIEFFSSSYEFRSISASKPAMQKLIASWNAARAKEIVQMHHFAYARKKFNAAAKNQATPARGVRDSGTWPVATGAVRGIPSSALGGIPG